MNGSKKRKLKLAIFVHELFMEVGHSNAMIETIRGIDPEKIEKLHIISYTFDDPEKLFPKLSGKIITHKVPLPSLYPFLIKMLWYHIWTAFFIATRLPSDVKKISIGIASLSADIINIQFVHKQWSPLFFASKKFSIFEYIYKLFLFSYFNFIEKIVYLNDKIKIYSLSEFVTNYCRNEFCLENHQIKTIYSGINLDKFKISDLEREDLFQLLCEKYPAIKNLDINKPIYMFVGAFERKGLPIVLESLTKLKEAQILVVGKSEIGDRFKFPQSLTVAHIEYTKELPLLYSLGDIFVFPTIYEPFGLVIIEAASMGLELYVTENLVGASEILKGMPLIHMVAPNKIVQFNDKTNALSRDQKIRLRKNRFQVLKKYSWQKNSDSFYQFISEDFTAN